ncbi:MAG: thiol:disulfide interchange protein DsbA/DsbL [Gammaproteobacteria bacterium]|nr:thiol:disulfide interchange protein DsbA/DsbL [Gammaproteobacteria bacterium]
MKRIVYWVLVPLLLALPPLLPAAEEPYAEGFDYERITPAYPLDDDAEVEVAEFFWYGCPHCYRFEPYLRRWLESKPEHVDFQRVAPPLNPGWRVHAKAFYAFEVMGVTDALHRPLFDAIHAEGRRLGSEEALADLAAEHEVDRSELTDTMRSFTVDTRVRRAMQLARRYGVNSVPTVIVAGKYRVTGPLAGTYENMIKIIGYLVEKEHASGE